MTSRKEPREDTTEHRPGMPEANPTPEENAEGRDLRREVLEFQQLVATSPAEALVRMMQLRERAAVAERSCLRAANAAAKLEKILTQLLEAPPVLCHVEGMDPGPNDGPSSNNGSSNGAAPKVLCRVSGELRRIRVHPEVSLEALRNLQPWEYACLAKNGDQELVVVGTYSHPELRQAAMGPIVEFKGYLDRGRGLARVARHGDDEEIVRLAPELRDAQLVPPAKLVLLRDDHRWAIDAVPVDRAESPYEVSLDKIHTRLTDLAGLEPIIEPLVKDVILRVVRNDLRAKFDLRPLKGILIYSFQPGTGKTSLMRGLSRWLGELGEERGFEVVLYVVPPNALKSKWHGEDARRVREDLCGAIRARQVMARDKPLFQLIVLDEIDAVGRRVGGDEAGGHYSSAQNDIVQALLHEMDGMIQPDVGEGNAPAHVLWVGLTNRPELLDEALKRGGRFADLVLEVPPTNIDSAESILAIYARSEDLPWYLDEEERTALAAEEIRERFLRPALARVFDVVVLRYWTDSQASVDVTAGDIMAGVHYMDALNAAKTSPANREMMGTGVPAVTFDDVVNGLLNQALSVAKSMEADRQMLVRQLRLKVPVNRVELVAEDELPVGGFLRQSRTKIRG